MTVEELRKNVQKWTAEAARETVREALAEVQSPEGVDVRDITSQANAARSDLAHLPLNAPQRVERATRVIMAIAAGKNDPQKAAAWYKAKWGEDAAYKALSSGTDTEGGFLIQEEFAAEVIELLRPASVVRSLNPIVVPLDAGTLNIPKHTTGSSGGWIGENANITATEPVFGQITLTAKKYASLVPISNDLLRRANLASVPQVVRDDLVGDIATATDIEFIRGDGMANKPTGLRNISGIQTLAANGTVNLQNVTDDLGKSIQGLLDSNVRMLRPGWMFAPRTWRWLFTIRDGNGNQVFRDEMARGTLFGFPFRITTQIPTNLGTGTDESEVYLVDFADVVIGEATSILISSSDQAAYHDGTNVVAAFSLDQTVIRALVEVDINLRHAASVHVLTAVTWGA